MYDFVDRRLDSLDDGARLLVWAMRRWVAAMAEQKCPAASVAPAFAARGLIAGLPRFHKAMALLNREGLETFAFAPAECPGVTESEAILLSLFREAKRAKPSAFQALVASLVADEAVAPMFEAVAGLAGLLAGKSLVPGFTAATLPRE